MRNHLLIIFIFLLTGSFIAQVTDIEADEWYPVYKSTDSDLTLYVKFEIPSNLCSQGSPTKFLYRYKGKPESSERYAKWELDYLGCNDVTYTLAGYAPLSKACKNMSNTSIGEEFHMQESDEIITAKELVELRSNAGFSSTYFSPEIKESTLKVSFSPSGLIANTTKIGYKESAIVTIKGGSLGEGASWYLYESSCGGKLIGSSNKDKSFTVSPEKTTVYYAQAKGTNNTTKCVEVKIEVDKSSKLPESIEGKSKICIGSPADLELIGGQLGPDSEWRWYKNNCGDEESKIVGTGVSLFDNEINETTTYYVRAESQDGDVTKCLSKTVDVVYKPNSPKDIELKAGTFEPCEGEKIVLSAEGELNEGCFWQWKDPKDKYFSNNNEEVILYPKISTTIELRMANDQCGSSSPVTKEIKVYLKSKKPSIEQVYSNNGKKSELVVTGGYLAENSKWVWYEEVLKNGSKIKKEIGTGDKINLDNSSKGKTYFVRAEGKKCNDTKDDGFAYFKVSSAKKPKPEKIKNPISSRYSLSDEKLHFGINFGVDYTMVADSLYSNDTLYDNIKTEVDYPVGYFVGLEFHPIIKEYFYLGLRGSYGGGIPYQESVKTFDTTTTTTSSNTNYKFGGELGWTISGSHVVKMFLSYDRTAFKPDISRELNAFDTIASSTLTFANFSNRNQSTLDHITLGFRFGSLGAINRTRSNNTKLNGTEKKPKQGHHLDLKLGFYNLNQSSSISDFSYFSKLYDWDVMFDVSYWRHSLWAFGFKMAYDKSISDLISGNTNVMPSYFQGYFRVNIDFFK